MSEYTGDAQSYPDAPTRDKLFTRWGMLKSERASWLAHWQEISTYLLPRNGRFFRQDHNKGWRRNNNIYDNTGTMALKTLSSGMLAGATSPARQWFRLATPDPELNSYQPVKLWLDDVTQRMQRVFQRSNTYRALENMYSELGAFGTAASVVLPDFKNVIHHYPVTCGEYCIATDFQGRVTTLYREFEVTVSDLVKEFGYRNCSITVRNMYDRGTLDAWIPIIHAIEPRTDRDHEKRDDKNMAYGSWYFEVGGEDGKFLRESGFKQFPALCPRWATAGGDIYGNSPGMAALGDIKQLQHEQLRKAQAIDFQTKPPLQVPVSMKNRDVETLPGGISFVDGAGMGIKTAFEVNLNLQYLLNDIVDCRQRIQSAFHADMFLMLATQPNTRMTATEVAERHEEKLLMLGPVLERLHNELLDPLVDITFTRMIQSGIVPPAPEELQGMDLNVEFVSMLAQAQRAIGTNSVDRFVGNLGAIAQMKPDVLDKFDSDQWADIYADMLGVDPSLIIADKEVAMVRNARNQAMAAKEQVAAVEQASKATRNLAASPTDQQTALTDVMNMFSGYGSPSALEV
jgi:hypothetical protein